jgi:hypothetical protein
MALETGSMLEAWINDIKNRRFFTRFFGNGALNIRCVNELHKE